MVFGLGKKTGLGIDIGSNFVKLVGISQGLSKPELTSVGIVPLPPGTIVDGLVEDRQNLVTALRELIKPVKLPHKHVAISISNNAVNIKRITVPEMTNRELDEHIVWEAEQYLPQEMLDDVHIDYNKINIPSRPGHMDVILVAAKRSAIKSFSDVLAEINLIPKVIDVECFALLNLLNHSYNVKPNDNILIINVGSSITNIVIARGGTVVYTREFEFGGKHFSQAMSKHLGISFEEAEAHKVRHTLRKAFPAEFEGIISVIMKDFCTYLKDAIDYFYTVNDDTPITNLFITGGGTKLSFFNQFLTSNLSIDAHLFNVFSKVDYNKRVFQENYIQAVTPMISVAMGLALRQLG